MSSDADELLEHVYTSKQRKWASMRKYTTSHCHILSDILRSPNFMARFVLFTVLLDKCLALTLSVYSWQFQVCFSHMQYCLLCLRLAGGSNGPFLFPVRGVCTPLLLVFTFPTQDFKHPPQPVSVPSKVSVAYYSLPPLLSDKCPSCAFTNPLSQSIISNKMAKKVFLARS